MDRGIAENLTEKCRRKNNTLF